MGLGLVPCGCERRAAKAPGDERAGAPAGGAPMRGASLLAVGAPPARRGDRSDSRPSTAAWLGGATTAGLGLGLGIGLGLGLGVGLGIG